MIGTFRDAPQKRGGALKGRKERVEVTSGSAGRLTEERAGNRQVA